MSAAVVGRDGGLCRAAKPAFCAAGMLDRAALLLIVRFIALDGGGKIAVVGGKDGVIEGAFPPCGVCRQVLREFCPLDFEILAVTSAEPLQFRRFTLEELLPYSFGPEFIH